MIARAKFDTIKQQGVYSAMSGLKAAVQNAGFEAPLYELVKVRASQLNGCGFCIDMHTKVARAAGETEQRLYLLSAWRETGLYNERERAALAWTEAVTTLEDRQVPDDIYEQARASFSEQELMTLTLAIVEINGWNRFAIAFRWQAGHYRPGMK